MHLDNAASSLKKKKKIHPAATSEKLTLFFLALPPTPKPPSWQFEIDEVPRNLNEYGSNSNDTRITECNTKKFENEKPLNKLQTAWLRMSMDTFSQDPQTVNLLLKRDLISENISMSGYIKPT